MYLSHLSPDYQCPILPDCEYRGQELLRRHKLEDDQEHQCWDKREHIREDVMDIVSVVVGEDMTHERKFINRLLLHTDVFDIVQTIQEKNQSEQTVAGDNDETGYEQLFLLIIEESHNYEKEKNAKQKEKEKYELRPQIKSLLHQVLPGDGYDTDDLVTEIIRHQSAVDAVKLLRETEDGQERMKAQIKMSRLLLPVILQCTLGEKVCERTRRQVGKQRWDDDKFVHNLLLGNIY